MERCERQIVRSSQPVGYGEVSENSSSGGHMAKFLVLLLRYANAMSRTAFTHKVRTSDTYSVIKTESIGFYQLPLAFMQAEVDRSLAISRSRTII